MMKTFSEILKDLNQYVDSLITKDTPTETITKLSELKEKTKELGDAHQQTLDDYAELKDRYIESVKHYGTPKVAPDDASGNSEKTFEQIGAEIISNRGKKQ